MPPDPAPPTPGSTWQLLTAGLLVARDPAEWVAPEAEDLKDELPAYLISGLFSKGGMGAVYRGQHRALGRAVAIKIMSPALDQDPVFTRRFLAEARAMAGLTHPGIVVVHDAGETAGGLLYYVMEFVEGSDLSLLLENEGKIPRERALSIARQVADALKTAHQAGIVHRDIKPSNVMLDHAGQVKVTDFGLARSPHLDEGTAGGLVMGTMDYMPPEAKSGNPEVDARADIYALGVMLFRMVTGQLPAGKEPVPAVIDPALAAVLKRAMAPSPADRYQTVDALHKDLSALTLTGEQQRGRRKKMGVMVAAVLVTAGLAGWGLRSGQEKTVRKLPSRDLTALLTAPPLPAEFAERAFPVGRWAGVKADPASSPSLLEDPGGWQRLPRWSTLQPLHAQGTNWGIRVTFRGLHQGRPPELLMREFGSKNYNACLYGGTRLVISRYDPDAPSPSTRLGELILKSPIPAGRPYQLTCFILGRRLVGRIGGESLEVTLADPPAMGRMALYGVSLDDFRDLQFLNLDGLPAEQAGAFITAAPPPEPALPVVPPARPPVPSENQWKAVDRTLWGGGNGDGQKADGWTRLTGRKLIQLHPRLATDGGLRATFQGRNPGPRPELNLRSGPHGNYNLYRSGAHLVLQHYQASAAPDQRYLTLSRVAMPPLLAGEAYTLELVAIGKHLRGKCGSAVCEVTLPAIETGALCLYGADMDGFRNLEVIVCDGLTASAARHAAGWTEDGK